MNDEQPIDSPALAKHGRNLKSCPAIVVAFIGACGLASAGCLPRGPARGGPIYGTITSITFTRAGKRQLHVEDPKLVSEFVNALRFKEGSECACDHLQRVVFKGPDSEMEATFCDHCFQVISRNGRPSWEYHRVTSQFYELFVRHVLEQGEK